MSKMWIVVFFSRPSQTEIFNVGVNVDIVSDEPIALDDLEQIFGSAIDSRKIDDLSVERDDYYELYAIQGNFLFPISFWMYGIQFILKLTINLSWNFLALKITLKWILCVIVHV